MNTLEKKSLNVRIPSLLMEALKEAAARDQRTVTSYLIRLIQQDCRRQSIPIQSPPPDDGPLRVESVATRYQDKLKE